MSLAFLFLLFLNSACQQGWISNGKSCYKLFTSSKTWENAKEECKKWNARLVKVESSEENDFIKRSFCRPTKTIITGLDCLILTTKVTGCGRTELSWIRMGTKTGEIRGRKITTIMMRIVY